STRSASSEEISRQKYRWVLQEVYPAMDDSAPIVWIGNTGRETSALFQAMLHTFGGVKKRLKSFLKRGTQPGVLGGLPEGRRGLPSPSDDGPDGRAPESPSDARDPLARHVGEGLGPRATQSPSDRSRTGVRGSDDLNADADTAEDPREAIDADISAHCYRATRSVVTPDGELQTEYLWPEAHAERWYLRKRRTMGPFIFESEENGCPIQEGTFFKREWLDAALYDEVPELRRVYSWLDPAFGTSGVGAYKSIVVLGTDGTDFYVLDAYCRNDEPLSAMLDAWYGMFRAWDHHGLRHGGYENDFGQDNRLSLDFKAANKRHGWSLPVAPDSNRRGSKDARIQSMQPIVSQGHLRFPREMSPDVETLFNQLLAYPDGADDGPDALESGIVRLRRGAASELAYESTGPPRRYARQGRRR
ncbi:MAG: hypothetical protein AAGN64_15515, partial [Bacteroidota bacterium]